MSKSIKGSLILILMLTSSGILLAQSDVRSVTNISFGSYSESRGDDRVDGTMMSIGYKRFFMKQWAYFISLGNGSASGEHENTDRSVQTLKSSRTSCGGGLLWHYLIDTKPGLIPFIGAGISIHNYAYEFDYVGSQIGTTSGTGFGPIIMAGARFEVAKHFVIIPGYQFEQIYLKSEGGGQAALTSSGFLLALVIRF
ncbi:MAG: outer membrane beta-barrel protein [SAR324 cluster bacterium]|nr:outer membrane beta-barrel protein [SAR324 cluster bacterium]